MLLRDYQHRVIADVRNAMRRVREGLEAKGVKRGPRVLIQMPTGGGKTAVAAFITQAAVQRGNTPVRFLANRDFLVDQTSQTYGRLTLDHSFIAAGRWYNPYTPIHIGMVQSVRSRLAKVTVPRIVIWDECHHIGASSWGAIMAAWPDATHIGLSATPIRLDGKGLDAWFDDIVIGPSVSWLITNGFLSDYIAYAPSSPDLSQLHSRAGDYVTAEVDELMDRAVIIGDMVRHYRTLAPGKKAVYFCTSVKHSQHVASMFNDAGFPWAHLDGTDETWRRRQVAQALAKGELMGVSNVDLFGEGYDLSAQAGMDVTIECVGLARPTKSLGMCLQQVGRALRPKPDKAVILDHAGNIKEHGLPDDDREWSLAGVKRFSSETIQCDGCGATVPAATVICRHCGAKLREIKARTGPAMPRQVEERDGDLQEIDKDALRKAKKLEEWQCTSLGELIDLARRRGYKDAERWAGYLWTEKRRRKEAREHSKKQQMDFWSGQMMERYGNGQ